MADTVSDFVVRRLSEWGVRALYGYPEDGINGLMGALSQGLRSMLRGDPNCKRMIAPSAKDLLS